MVKKGLAAVFLCVVLLLGIVSVSVSAQGPIAQAVTIGGKPVPVFKIGAHGQLEFLGTISSGTRVGIYSFGHFFFGQEYVKNDPINQYIRRADLYVLTGNETKSDRRPLKVTITPEYKKLGEGGEIRYYNKPPYYSTLVVVAVVPAALDGPLPLTDIAAVVLISGASYIAYQNSPAISSAVTQALGPYVQRVETVVQGFIGLEVWAAEAFRHHVLEGNRAEQRLKLLSLTREVPCAECWYRNEFGRDEAIALIFKTTPFKTGGHSRLGVIFIHNRTNSNSSTVLAGDNPPPGFSQQLPLWDPKCQEAINYMNYLIKNVLK